MRLFRGVAGCLVPLIGVVGCGGDGSSTGSTTVDTTVAGNQIEVPAHDASGQTNGDPVTRSVRCRTGTMLGHAGSPTIDRSKPNLDPLTMLVSADGSSFCIVNSAGAEDVVPFEPGRVVSEPETRVARGTIANYLVVAIPAGWGPVVGVTSTQGRQLSSAITRDGTVMLAVDFAPVGASSDLLVDRTFTFTGSAGHVLGEVTVPAPSTGALEDVLACLAKHDVHVAPSGMPDTGPLDKQPLDPAVASEAWAACRPVAVLSFATVGYNPREGELETLDCMASKGFIQMFMGGNVDAAAQVEAYSLCTRPLPASTD